MNDYSALEGHIVAIERRVGTLSTGLYEGQPTERKVVKINRARANGIATSYDADGILVVLMPDEAIEDFGPARAGWMTW